MGYELLPGHTPGATGHMVLFTPQQVLVQSCLQCHRTQNINKKAKVERLYHCAKPTLHASHKTVKEITVSISTLYCKREFPMTPSLFAVYKEHSCPLDFLNLCHRSTVCQKVETNKCIIVAQIHYTIINFHFHLLHDAGVTS